MQVWVISGIMFNVNCCLEPFYELLALIYKMNRLPDFRKLPEYYSYPEQ
jgi:hypothetical protein